MICRHCSKNQVTRPRGLCDRCYYKPAIRCQYPVGTANPETAKYLGEKRGGVRELTQAEVDALVAEGLANLPPWWNDGYVLEYGQTDTQAERQEAEAPVKKKGVGVRRSGSWRRRT